MVGVSHDTSAFAAHAQQYPTKPVRVLIGYAAGSSTDIVGRVMADRLGAYWKQTVIVENQGGAGGLIGTEMAARSQPDGYTLLLGALSNIALNPGLYPKLAYDPRKDFAPVGLIATSALVVLTNLDDDSLAVQALQEGAQDYLIKGQIEARPLLRALRAEPRMPGDFA